MQQRITILNELKEISQVVANLPATIPYQVPSGYFDELAQRLTVMAKSSAGMENIFEEGNKAELPYSVPEGYFDDLAKHVFNRIRTEKADPAEEISRLSPLISKLEKNHPFTVPEGYFTEMPSNVVAGIQALDFVQGELEIISPELLELRDRPVFTIPEGYFEGLPSQILSKVKPEAKVVGGNFGRQFVRFAAAASVIGIMAVGLVMFNRKSDNGLANNPTATAIELDSSLNQISDAAIRTYIDNNHVNLAEPTNTSPVEMQPEDVKEMLADVSDSDLESYLRDYGITKDDLNN